MCGRRRVNIVSNPCATIAPATYTLLASSRKARWWMVVYVVI